jgi:hypothetical protein
MLIQLKDARTVQKDKNRQHKVQVEEIKRQHEFVTATQALAGKRPQEDEHPMRLLRNKILQPFHDITPFVLAPLRVASGWGLGRLWVDGFDSQIYRYRKVQGVYQVLLRAKLLQKAL